VRKVDVSLTDISRKVTRSNRLSLRLAVAVSPIDVRLALLPPAHPKLTIKPINWLTGLHRLRVLDLRTTTVHECAAVPRRARI
jgi:hypothetical protein